MKPIVGYLYHDADGTWLTILDISETHHYTIFDEKTRSSAIETAQRVALVLGCRVETWQDIKKEDGK